MTLSLLERNGAALAAYRDKDCQTLLDFILVVMAARIYIRNGLFDEAALVLAEISPDNLCEVNSIMKDFMMEYERNLVGCGL